MTTARGGLGRGLSEKRAIHYRLKLVTNALLALALMIVFQDASIERGGRVSSHKERMLDKPSRVPRYLVRQPLLLLLLMFNLFRIV